MIKSERLNKLKELNLIYEREINSLLNEASLLETGFKAYADEVKLNGKKSDKRMTIAGLLLSFGTFLSTFVIPLTGANVFACIFVISFLAFAGINAIVQWRKSEKCDKQIEGLKNLEVENFNKIFKLKEKIAMLEQKNIKVKDEIKKLYQNLSSEQTVQTKKVEKSVLNDTEITK